MILEIKETYRSTILTPRNIMIDTNFNIEDCYFWLDDRFNPIKKKYFMIKILKRAARCQNKNQ